MPRFSDKLIERYSIEELQKSIDDDKEIDYPSKEYLNQCVGHRPMNEVMELSKDGAKLVVVDTFSLKRAPFWPYYHQISNNSGVVVLNDGNHKVIPIPEWNELPEETFLDYFES